jgi:hypothetical protein
MTSQDPPQLGIPVDFVLFGLTLAGIAIFHKCTMPVALTSNAGGSWSVLGPTTATMMWIPDVAGSHVLEKNKPTWQRG